MFVCQSPCSTRVAQCRREHHINKRNLCCRGYDLDVNSCFYLQNDAQAARSLLLLSVVSCCWKVIVCPRYFAHSCKSNTSTLILLIVTSCFLLELWLLRIFVFQGVSSIQLFLCFAWNHTTCFAIAPAMLHIRARRRRVSSLCGNLTRNLKSVCPRLISATWPGVIFQCYS